MVRYMVWYGTVWYGMVRYCMVWYGMVWYGTVSYRMVNGDDNCVTILISDAGGGCSYSIVHRLADLLRHIVVVCIKVDFSG